MKLRASVIIVEKNSERDIRELLGALLDQTFRDFEVIIIDNYSIDNTRKIIDTMRQVFINKNIRLHIVMSHEDVGANRQLGVDLAESKIICFLDGDEIPDKDWLEKIMNKFNEDLDIELIRTPQRSYPDKSFFYKCLSAIYDQKEEKVRVKLC